MKPSRVIRCPECVNDRGKPRYVAYAPFPAMVTGRVRRAPADGDAEEIAGLGYSPCFGCKRYVRYEFVPPEIVVADAA